MTLAVDWDVKYQTKPKFDLPNITPMESQKMVDDHFKGVKLRP